MIHTAGEGFDDAFHFELEKDGCELSDRDAGLDTEDIELQVVGLLKQADNLLFWFREIREEISFDSIG
jgi:Tfp pilus assembly ATPase PilU